MEAPKVKLLVEDKSILRNTPPVGIICLQGPTKRGRVGVPTFISNQTRMLRLMGGEFDDDRFPALCNRLLAYGARLWISRAGHYTDIADKDTVAGTKASVTITEASLDSVWNAEDVGAGYNGTTIKIEDASSGVAAKKDITVTLPDSDVSQTYFDVDEVLDADGIAALNEQLEGVQLVSITTSLGDGTGTLINGAQDVSAIVAADYNGNVVGTGWYAFDAVTDAFRIANIAIQDPDVDVALANYTVARGDMRFHIATPLGATATGMLDYREGTGAYSHDPIDTWYGELVGGDINVNDRADTKKKFNIPGLVDVLGLHARKDELPWLSAAGPKRGQVTEQNNGVPYNLGSAALSGQYDLIYPKGVNAVISDKDYGTIYWGNKSLLRNPRKILSKSNVADLLVYIIRELKPVLRFNMFDPNDPIMWREIYRNVLPVIGFLESNRAIVPGENTNWFWQGDQDASTIQDVVHNDVTDVSNSIYKVRFIFLPIVATEFITLAITPTDANSLSFVVEN